MADSWVYIYVVNISHLSHLSNPHFSGSKAGKFTYADLPITYAKCKVAAIHPKTLEPKKVGYKVNRSLF